MQKNPTAAYLTQPQVQRFFGGVSRMTIRRWRDDPELDFPVPIVIRGRPMWRIDELHRFADERREWKVPAERIG